MPKYKLKSNQPNFEVVDGPMAGRKFKAGVIYTEIPEAEKGRFEKIPEAPEIKVSAPDPKIKEVKNGS